MLAKLSLYKPSRTKPPMPGSYTLDEVLERFAESEREAVQSEGNGEIEEARRIRMSAMENATYLIQVLFRR